MHPNWRRIVETLIAAGVAGLVAGMTAVFATAAVLQRDIEYQQQQIAELKAEFQEFRRDFYSPRYGPDAFMPELQLEDLVGDLRASLMYSATAFTGIKADQDADPPVEADPDADFRRHLRVAAADLAARSGRILVGEFTLQADKSIYAEVPEDLVAVRLPIWGRDQQHVLPWDRTDRGPLPRLRLYRKPDGERELLLLPPPTVDQIQQYGSTFRYYYVAGFETGEDQYDLDARHRNLLMLRAQAEACKELAMRGMTKPVEVRSGQPVTTRNMTPRALFEALMHEYRVQLGESVPA